MYEREAIKVLRKTRKLIQKPEAWTQCAQARDKDGGPVSSVSKRAVSWCLSAAIVKCQKKTRDGREVTDRIVEAMIRVINRGRPTECWASTVGYNDTGGRKHGEVLELIDTTIEKLEEEAGGEDASMKMRRHKGCGCWALSFWRQGGMATAFVFCLVALLICGIKWGHEMSGGLT